MADLNAASSSGTVQLRRALRLRDLILYGIIIIQPTAPMPVFGIVSQTARGHVVTAVLIAMVAMLFTAVSYGRMARILPSAGSAYSYVSHALHPGFGYLAGWSVALDYMLNPVICTIWCSKAAQNFFPYLPFWLLAVFFAGLFTLLNLRGIETSARINFGMALGMGVIVLLFLFYAGLYIAHQHLTTAALLLPFYDPASFNFSRLGSGVAIAVLTYIGFDSVSTLGEEVENPRRNILLATVLVCVITGALAAIEVYAAQLVWPDYAKYPDVDTAFVHIAGRAGGAWLFAVMNFTLLVATVGSGFTAQLAAARLLLGMGRDNAIPRRFFGAVDQRTRIPRNNVLFCGAVALAAGLSISYTQGAELLNFGAFMAFMGVNAAAFWEYCVRQGQRSWQSWVPPVLGFVVCFYIWLHLSSVAKIAGSSWLVLGAFYGWRRGVFRKRSPKPA
ncbi:MAG TPA: APC family permease [Bryobacteraceae bacterium]|nr:APC family permease [Bryobacteraceae bacterium]